MKKEVSGWLKPRAPKPITAELVDPGPPQHPKHKHIHTCQVENVGHILVSSVAKFRQGTSVVSGPRLISLNTEPRAAPLRGSLLEEGGGRRERKGRGKDKERGAAGQQLARRGRRVSSACSRSQQSELVRRLKRAAPEAEKPLASLSQAPSDTFWDQAPRQKTGGAGAYLLPQALTLGITRILELWDQSCS